MKAFLPPTLAMLIGFSLLHADTDRKALGKLTARIGDKFWSPPEKRLVRATIYGKGADDGDSAKGKSDEKIGLRHATAKEAGTLAVPQWLPRGSMVKIHTEHGVLAYIAADEGPSVEARHAAKESGKTEEQKAASVLDFCAAEQLWPDFVIVEIYYYAGKVPFNEHERVQLSSFGDSDAVIKNFVVRTRCLASVTYDLRLHGTGFRGYLRFLRAQAISFSCPSEG